MRDDRWDNYDIKTTVLESNVWHFNRPLLDGFNDIYVRKNVAHVTGTDNVPDNNHVSDLSSSNLFEV